MAAAGGAPSAAAPASPSPAEEITDKYAHHPGSMETLHNRTKEIFPDAFDGARLVFNKGLSRHFQASHTVTMSSADQSGYKFGATYVGTTKYSEAEMSPILMGEVHPGDGKMSGQMIVIPRDWCRIKGIMQVQKGRAEATQLSCQLRDPITNVGLTLASVDLNSGKAMAMLEVVRGVAGRHSLGSMLVLQRAPGQIPGDVMAMATLGGRWVSSGGQWEASCTLAPFQMHANACFVRRINDSLSVATELETDYRQQMSVAGVAYQYELAKANVGFRASLNSQWCCSAVLEKRLLPYPFTLQFCGSANHVKASYRFGLGLQIG